MATLCKRYSLKKPEIIVPLSYGATPEGPTTQTYKNTIMAGGFWTKLPHALIVYGNAGYLFEGAIEVENAKKRTLQQMKVPDDQILYAGSINNSIQEATAIRDTLEARRIKPNRILLCTGEMHSRSIRAIWRYFFPKGEILVSGGIFGEEYQWDHPVFLERGPWRWLMANIMRHIGFRAAMYCERYLPFIPFTPATLARVHHWVPRK